MNLWIVLGAVIVALSQLSSLSENSVDTYTTRLKRKESLPPRRRLQVTTGREKPLLYLRL
ncbi:hypothetical protein COJ37_13615 [Bacillus cereus]|nr:hypothetical protein VK96_15700 [Bacillus cereus]PEX19854.1 hypothetical protein CN452_12135 [Bacillus cereus]PFM00583.1 hypothetical protein COJ37_13615 [Bacillus cereus]PFU08543.1 hypothetical protein COK79_25665 [Bacillus cereus]PGW67715.1 hypothetical protein COE26_14430 [Bacillus cereus]